MSPYIKRKPCPVCEGVLFFRVNGACVGCTMRLKTEKRFKREALKLQGYDGREQDTRCERFKQKEAEIMAGVRYTDV